MKTKYKYIIALLLILIGTIYVFIRTFNTYSNYVTDEVEVITTEIKQPDLIYARFLYFDTVAQNGFFELQVEDSLSFLKGKIDEVYVMNGEEIITRVFITETDNVIADDQVDEYGIEEILAFQLKEYVPFFDHLLFKIDNSDFVVYIGPSYFEEKEIVVSEFVTDGFIVQPETQEDVQTNEGKPFYRIPNEYDFEFEVPSTLSRISASYFLSKDELTTTEFTTTSDFTIKDDIIVDVQSLSNEGIDIIAYEKIGVLTEVSSGLKQVTSKRKYYFVP
jgi:hypothetical protein